MIMLLVESQKQKGMGEADRKKRNIFSASRINLTILNSHTTIKSMNKLVLGFDTIYKSSIKVLHR